MTDDEMMRHAMEVSRRLTRRRFLRGTGAALGGLALGPAVLSACGGDDGDDSSSEAGDPSESSGDALTLGSGTVDQNDLYHANWTGYLDTETPTLWEQATGLKLFYSEEVNDNNEYFAKIRPELSQGNTIQQDIITLTSWITPRFIDLGWLEKIPFDSIPNAANLAPDFTKPPNDPTGEWTLPWLSGIAGIAYNRTVTGGDLTSAEALFDPQFKGKVGFLLEMRDTVGVVAMLEGLDITKPDYEEFEPVFDKIQKAVDDGQARSFSGQDYLSDLSQGNYGLCVAWSGDILGNEDPNLGFFIPETGGTRWFDTMMIPKGSPHVDNAAKWMDFVYDPVNSARITTAWPYTSPVVGTQDALRAMGGESAALADEPLLYPDEATAARLQIFGKLDEEQEILFDERFAEITGQ